MPDAIRGTPLLWGVIAVHLIFTVLNTVFRLVPPVLTGPIIIGLVIVITTMHALKRYSLTQYLVFAAITFVVSSFYENLSVLTGFPFGDYYYSDRLGLKLFLVPLVIAPAYFAAGYCAWSIAHVLLGLFERRPRGADLVLLPVVASFVTVMWDLIMDPVMATINDSWIWEGGGAYFGVPFQNYLGWLLCLYTIFQLFALYLAWNAKGRPMPAEIRGTDRTYWFQAIVPFFTMSLAWMLRMFTTTDTVVTDPSGQAWNTGDIYQSVSLVAIFTMWFVCLLAAALTLRKPAGRF